LPTVDLSSATTGTGLATMTINNLKARFNTAADAITSTLSSTGTDSFAVGTLNIGATQIPGVYTGTFDVYCRL
jgi:hypothetical protein